MPISKESKKGRLTCNRPNLFLDLNEQISNLLGDSGAGQRGKTMPPLWCSESVVTCPECFSKGHPELDMFDRLQAPALYRTRKPKRNEISVYKSERIAIGTMNSQVSLRVSNKAESVLFDAIWICFNTTLTRNNQPSHLGIFAEFWDRASSGSGTKQTHTPLETKQH